MYDRYYIDTNQTLDFIDQCSQIQNTMRINNEKASKDVKTLHVEIKQMQVCSIFF